MGRHLLAFGVLRRKAAARVPTGGAFPGSSVSILCVQNAALSWADKSLLLASVQGSLDSPVAGKQMRRLFNPYSGPARKDVLTAADTDAQSDEEDLSYESWAAIRKAEKIGGDSIDVNAGLTFASAHIDKQVACAGGGRGPTEHPLAVCSLAPSQSASRRGSVY